MHEIGITKEDATDTLQKMYARNPAVKRLIQVFKLEWKSSPVIDEKLTEAEIIQLLNNSKKSIMTTTKKTTDTKKESKFKTEVEASQMRSFLKFKEIGEAVEGFIIGKETIKGKEKSTEHYVIKDGEGVESLLPENVQLVNKLNNLVKIKGGSIPEDGIEVRIEFTGEEKIEGSINKVKCFRVLTV